MRFKKLMIAALLVASAYVPSVMANGVDEALYATHDIHSIYTLYVGMDAGDLEAEFDALPDWKKEVQGGDLIANIKYKRTMADGTQQELFFTRYNGKPVNDIRLSFDTKKYKEAAEMFYKVKAKMEASCGKVDDYNNHGNDQDFYYYQYDVCVYGAFLRKGKDGSGHFGIMVYNPPQHAIDSYYNHTRRNLCGK